MIKREELQNALERINTHWSVRDDFRRLSNGKLCRFVNWSKLARSKRH